MKNVSFKGIPCVLQGCTGTYMHRRIFHCVEQANETVCIDHVPALVCDVCGDVQLEPGTVRRIQYLIDQKGTPDKHVPAYDFDRPASAA